MSSCKDSELLTPVLIACTASYCLRVYCPCLYRCRFVRLYYVDDLTCTDEELTLTLAFPFDAELVLKFPGGWLAWLAGLAGWLGWLGWHGWLGLLG